jgi:thymidine kinase
MNREELIQRFQNNSIPPNIEVRHGVGVKLHGVGIGIGVGVDEGNGTRTSTNIPKDGVTNRGEYKKIREALLNRKVANQKVYEAKTPNYSPKSPDFPPPKSPNYSPKSPDFPPPKSPDFPPPESPTNQNREEEEDQQQEDEEDEELEDEEVDQEQELEVEDEEDKQQETIGIKKTKTARQQKPKEPRTKKKVVDPKESTEDEVVEQQKPKKSRTKNPPPPPLPPLPKTITIKSSPHYQTNRRHFLTEMGKKVKEYKERLQASNETATCQRSEDNEEFQTLVHQQIVQEYLNLQSPYRGLLLYHSLGSGKSCTSISVAESFKNQGKKIIVMSPASLDPNYRFELKKCGDPMYKKKQKWRKEEVGTKKNNEKRINELSKYLKLDATYIRKNGAWIPDIENGDEFDTLDNIQRNQIEKQIDQMIESQYTFFHYNGGSKKAFQELTKDGNPFDNKVVIIDEAHNLVSRIVNKLAKSKAAMNSSQESIDIYKYLMDAEDCRIVLLSGTPIINYPNEAGVLFNILRGFIKTWTFKISQNRVIDHNVLIEKLVNANFYDFDYIDVNVNTLSITRNPFGFKNKYKNPRAPRTTAKNKVPDKGGLGGSRKRKQKPKPNIGGAGEFDRYIGVEYDSKSKMEQMNDELFAETIKDILSKNQITIQGTHEVTKHLCLPHDSNEFKDKFINFVTNRIDEQNEDLLKRRILGLTSYFRSTQETLLPNFVLTTDGNVYHIILCEMSDHQFTKYDIIREEEVNKEKKGKKGQRKITNDDNNKDVFEIPTNYRQFSRMACNFTFPSSITRPIPIHERETEEDADDGADDADDDGADDADDEGAESAAEKRKKQALLRNKKLYRDSIDNAMKEVNTSEYLSATALPIYSPKYARMLENIQNTDHIGLHLVYSNYREVEGIGIIRLILLQNGFTELEFERTPTLRIKNFESSNPRFVLYTGTESAEDRELIRNIYNGSWHLLPDSLKEQLESDERYKTNKNLYGDVVKILMITASGAEGINLKNTRYVHISEPYWNMVRIEQVVGRARRICSHEELPEDKRTVQVFFYMASFSEKQRTEDAYIAMRSRDTSKNDLTKPVTSDEALYEIALKKYNINQSILNSIKSTAMDCRVYNNGDETYQCYDIGKVESNQMLSIPDIIRDSSETPQIKEVKTTYRIVEIKDVKYASLPVEDGDGDEYYLFKYDPNTETIGVKVGRFNTKSKTVTFFEAVKP